MIEIRRLERWRSEFALRRTAWYYAPSYRISLSEAGAGLALALVGLLFEEIGSVYQLLVFIAGFVLTLFGVKSAVATINAFRENLRDNNFYVQRAYSIKRFGNHAFSSVSPASDEAAVGYRTIPFAETPCIASEAVDNRMVLLGDLPVVRLPHKKIARNADSNDKRSRAQFATLYYTVKAELRTTNEAKVGMGSSASGLPDSISVFRTDYFEGILTHEAFSSLIMERDSVDPPVIDGTQWYPAEMNNDRLMLHDLSKSEMSGQIGCGALVIDAHGHPLFARQSAINLQEAGKLVSLASGSMNWEDFSEGGRSENFLDAVQWNIAREGCEEMGILRPSTCAELNRIRLAEVAKCTMVTGFIRMIHRSGKPDFLGVIRLPEGIDAGVDNYEIEKLGDSSFDFRPLKRMADFIDLHKAVVSFQGEVAVSTYFAIRRLAEIASYENSSIKEQALTWRRVSDFLRLQ